MERNEVCGASFIRPITKRRRVMITKVILIVLSAVGLNCLAINANADGCEPAATATSVTPCNETKSGIVIVSGNGTVSVSAPQISGDRQRWQFMLRTAAYYNNPVTGQTIQLSESVNSAYLLMCGANEPVSGPPTGFLSTLYPNGTYTSHYEIFAKKEGAMVDDYSLVAQKSCNFVVGND
jgi:hypothetical protein